jgi:pimeloyl-ACP methyl ester carboxylesterase
MLNYTEFGQGPTLLIAHGLYGSAKNWGVIAKRLSDTRRVITVDMRNHGDSPRFDTNSYPEMASDLAQVIEHIGGPVDVLGHSMGGKTAMMLALNFPDLVRSLIVGDIAPVSYSHTQIHFLEAMKAVDLSRVTRRSEASAQLADLGVEPALQSFFTQSLDLTNKRWKLNFDALTLDMDKILSFPPVTTTFNGPTLCLSGAASDYVTPEHRPTIKPLFPNARFAKIPQAGHWLHAERPREFEAAVRTYLDAVSPQT